MEPSEPNNTIAILTILAGIGWVFLFYWAITRKDRYEGTVTYYPSPKLSEESIRTLGYSIKKTYTHDQFFTIAYIKGAIMVEFTYGCHPRSKAVMLDNLISVDVTIDEVVGHPITFENLEALTKILAKTCSTCDGKGSRHERGTGLIMCFDCDKGIAKH